MSGDSIRPGSENRDGPVLKRFVDYLVSHGYTASSVQESARIIEHYSRWLGGRPMSRATAQKFLRQHLPNCRYQSPVIRYARRNHMALHRLLAMIQPLSPHTIRHTTAMHLLQSGVDLSTIAMWLGHESIETTHQYLTADMESKRQALSFLEPPRIKKRRRGPDKSSLAFLENL